MNVEEFWCGKSCRNIEELRRAGQRWHCARQGQSQHSQAGMSLLSHPVLLCSWEAPKAQKFLWLAQVCKSVCALMWQSTECCSSLTLFWTSKTIFLFQNGHLGVHGTGSLIPQLTHQKQEIKIRILAWKEEEWLWTELEWRITTMKWRQLCWLCLMGHSSQERRNSDHPTEYFLVPFNKMKGKTPLQKI